MKVSVVPIDLMKSQDSVVFDAPALFGRRFEVHASRTRESLREFVAFGCGQRRRQATARVIKSTADSSMCRYAYDTPASGTGMAPEVTAVETVEFEFERADVGPDDGFNLVYDPGETTVSRASVLRVHTDSGIVGETLGSVDQRIAEYLLGENPLRRERHWSELKRAYRQGSGSALGPVDVALWDVAGKIAGLPIHHLLGSYRDRLPCYASTPHGDENGGLDCPEAYADFAESCLERGYPAFKIHGWGGSDDARDVEREIETVRAVAERVGDEMDLMLDPACEFETFTDALKVGRALDEAEFLWYEDPFRDGGVSHHAHRKLRQRLDTPLLLTEHTPGLEQHSDFAAAEATDYLRGDLYHGITGLMKVAHTAEGFGLDVELHGPRPAMRHCMAAIRNTNYYEMGLVHPDWSSVPQPQPWAGTYEDNLDTVDEAGTVPVPDGPGLGVDIDWDFVEANEVDRQRYH
jgi:L-alanine-DL-glutamate epimerase-like enolase superfamily enzyme